MNLQLKFTKTYDQPLEFNLALPAFYIDRVGDTITDAVAILSEDEMVRVWENKGVRDMIENHGTEGRDEEIMKFHNTFQLSSEEEFFEIFDRVYKRLNPRRPMVYHAEISEAEKDYRTNNPL